MEKKQTSLEVIKEKAVGMENMLEKFQVTNDDELAIVADKIKDVKTLCKFIEGKKDEYVAPAKLIIDKAKEDFDPYIKQCKNAEIVLKQRAVKYHDEVEAKRKIEEKKIVDKVDTGYIKPETAMNKLEALPTVQKNVRTDNASVLSFAKRKVATVEKPELIPDEYWVIDEVRVRKEALLRDKEGQPQIPGVKITEETSSSSR